MKKTITLLTAIVITASSFSQVFVGVQATGNLSSANLKAEELSKPEKTMKLLPGAGIVADVQLTSSIGIRTGINYLQQGVKFKTIQDGVAGEIESFDITATTSLNYLQLPVNLLYTKTGKAVCLYAGGGPYISYGISGKVKASITSNFSGGQQEVVSEESDAFKKDEEGNTPFKRTDVGIGVLAGVKFSNGMFANIGYQYSLTNINKDASATYKNRGMQLSIGYYLWSKK